MVQWFWLFRATYHCATRRSAISQRNVNQQVWNLDLAFLPWLVWHMIWILGRTICLTFPNEAKWQDCGMKSSSQFEANVFKWKSHPWTRDSEVQVHSWATLICSNVFRSLEHCDVCTTWTLISATNVVLWTSLFSSQSPAARIRLLCIFNSATGLTEESTQRYQAYHCMSLLGPHKWLNCTELIEFVELGPHFVFHREANQTAIEAPQMIRSRWVATRSASWLMCSSNNVAFFDDASLQKMGKQGENAQRPKISWDLTVWKKHDYCHTSESNMQWDFDKIWNAFQCCVVLLRWYCGESTWCFLGSFGNQVFVPRTFHDTYPDIRVIQC